MMKNIISRYLFGTDYSQLPLASELIVDLKAECIRNKFLAFLLSAALVLAVLYGVSYV